MRICVSTRVIHNTFTETSSGFSYIAISTIRGQTPTETWYAKGKNEDCSSHYGERICKINMIKKED